MQIVIDIPEEMYKNVLNGTYCGTLYEELKNGKTIPKGHGRLIDADALKVSTGTIDDWAVEEFVYLDEIEDAPTIIEADKEEEG